MDETGDLALFHWYEPALLRDHPGNLCPQQQELLLQEKLGVFPCSSTIAALPRVCFMPCMRLEGGRWRQERFGHHGDAPEGLNQVPGGSGGFWILFIGET